jgi:photosystem II stability/assembly factor-like uncharacterized protein
VHTKISNMKKVLLLLFFLPLLSAKAQLFTPFGNANGGVFCIKTDTTTNDLYIGGNFTKVVDGLYNIINIAKYNGSTWSNFDGGGNIGGPILAIEMYKGKPYIAGQSGSIDYWSGTRWETTPGSFSGFVRRFAVYDGELYAGGDFEYANGQAVHHLARWDGTSWKTVNGGLNGDVYALFVSGSKLYVGGDFTKAGDSTVAHGIAVWDGTSWSALGKGLTTGYIRSITSYRGNIYAGGSFTTGDSVPAAGFAKWDGNSWLGIGSGVNVSVWETIFNMTVLDDELYLDGNFDSINGMPASNIAKYDGKTWSTFGKGLTDGGSYTGGGGMDACKSNLYIGGAFKKADTLTVSNIVRLIPKPSKEKEILTYGFYSVNPVAIGVISDSVISVTVPYRTDVTALVSTFTNSTGSTIEVNGVPQISGSTPNNFTNPVIYKLTAQDLSVKYYKVIVTVAPNYIWDWYKQNSGVSNTLTSVFFVDDNNGWTVGTAGTILHTTNGGDTWTSQKSGVTQTLLSVKFTSPAEGWIVGMDELILHTTDAGATWKASFATQGLPYTSVSFVNTQEGWIGGRWGKVMHTADGGVTWTDQQSGFDTQIASIYFKDANHGWAVGDDASNVAIKTNNGGKTWTLSYVGITCPLHCVYFVDTLLGYVAGKFNWGSSDGGEEYGGMNAPPYMNGIQFLDRNVGYCVGDTGRIAYTTDMGITWNMLASGTTKGLNAIHINPSIIAWTVGANGTILKNQPGKIITTVDEHPANCLTTYPNPSNGQFTVEMGKAARGQFTVYNLLGEKIYQFEISNPKLEIDLSDQPNGIYFIHVKADQDTSTQKITIRK